MCLAIEEMRGEAKAEGMKKGKEEGIIITLVNLVKKGMLTLAQADEETNMMVFRI